MKRYLSFIFILGLIFTGCLKKEEKTEMQPIPKKEIVQDLELEQWREEINKPSYRILVSNFKNPFISVATFKALSQKEESIPLELVGIIVKQGEKWALIQDATRKGYILKIGGKIGPRKIIDISKDYVVIEEEIEDIFGEKIKNIKKITLKKEKI
ncbi:MAG: pilus assembly protein PilP [Elusimicrobiota bacterium]|nr:pilus assembly protein PilP [Endomicrobiia bacterium]MDW8166692.1 pilus assembly protein PilP [Elusimicrobiota bacterium]